ncbi:hypothetical protein EDD18DRAFT_1112821 [Armillaria luteobubalina]|uniref:Uncharacterized protein n=1 Tax=Armillaria luteobubalina TaxID=153913 RepID=A0AA39PD19_9AGAR|nr:hypothetical protein EDD18DRAFT_1112821 [Armillaria luteobubalina]
MVTDIAGPGQMMWGVPEVQFRAADIFEWNLRSLVRSNQDPTAVFGARRQVSVRLRHRAVNDISLCWVLVPHRHRIQVLGGISIFMYFMATLHLALKWFYARQAFIMNGETAETRFHFLSDALIAGGPLWIPVISSIATGINGNTTLSSPWGDKSINWGMAYYSMTLSTMIICTMLILFRLSRARAAGTPLHFAPNPYQKVMEIVVESAAIYDLALAVYIPFLGADSPYSTYPQAVLSSVTPLSTPETRGSVTSLEVGTMFITPTKGVQAV